jgi:pyruvate carboxylase
MMLLTTSSARWISSPFAVSIVLMPTFLSRLVTGPQNNIPLLRDILTNPKFRSGNFNTKFMPQEYPDGFKGL